MRPSFDENGDALYHMTDDGAIICHVWVRDLMQNMMPYAPEVKEEIKPEEPKELKPKKKKKNLGKDGNWQRKHFGKDAGPRFNDDIDK